MGQLQSSLHHLTQGLDDDEILDDEANLVSSRAENGTHYDLINIRAEGEVLSVLESPTNTDTLTAAAVQNDIAVRKLGNWYLTLGIFSTQSHSRVVSVSSSCCHPRQKLRALRHPGIVRFQWLQKEAKANTVSIVVERISAISASFDELTCSDLFLGAMHILQALEFLHDRVETHRLCAVALSRRAHPF